MTIREHGPRHEPGYQFLVDHPILSVHHITQGHPFPDWEPPVDSIQFGAHHVFSFVEHVPVAMDQIIFYLRERRDARGLVPGIELVVGTRRTGDRIKFVCHESRSDFDGTGDLVNWYWFWQLVNPDEQKVAIRSTKSPFTDYNILQNKRPGEEDTTDGYQSASTVEITLERDGILILTPILPFEKFPPERFMPLSAK